MVFCNGQRIGFSLISPCNLPKATRLPVKLTDPKTIPNSIGNATLPRSNDALPEPMFVSVDPIRPAK